MAQPRSTKLPWKTTASYHTNNRLKFENQKPRHRMTGINSTDGGGKRCIAAPQRTRVVCVRVGRSGRPPPGQTMTFDGGGVVDTRRKTPNGRTLGASAAMGLWRSLGARRRAGTRREPLERSKERAPREAQQRGAVAAKTAPRPTQRCDRGTARFSRRRVLLSPGEDPRLLPADDRSLVP